MSEIKTTSLFESAKLGPIELTNKTVMAPMTRCRAIGNIPNDLMAEYYRQRASAGLIITEGVAPSPNGLGYARIPGTYSNEQVEGWKKVTSAVHEEGGKIFMQIMHTGRVGHDLNLPEGGRIIGASDVTAPGDMWTDQEQMQPHPKPHALTTEEVKETIQEYVRAATNAIEAGFDGVELHSANGYLPNQFLDPAINNREDEFGGSVENRAKFVLEVVKAMSEAIGKEKIGIRFSPYSTFNSISQFDETFETYDYLSVELNKLDIAYIHLVEGALNQSEEGSNLVSKIRENFEGAIIANTAYDAASAEEVLNSGIADLVAFGVPFLANPDLPHRLQNGLELNEPDQSTFYMADEKGYTDYPFAG